jgi:hypothetical protein
VSKVHGPHLVRAGRRHPRTRIAAARLRFLRLTARPSTRYSRYTRLRFTLQPCPRSITHNRRCPKRGRANANSRNAALNSAFLSHCAWQRQLLHATPISPQARGSLTRYASRSRTTSGRPARSNHFLRSPIAISLCPGSDLPPSASTSGFLLPVVATVAPRSRSDLRTSPSRRRACASTPPPYAPPRHTSCPSTFDGSHR